jgi:hypothetical protein
MKYLRIDACFLSFIALLCSCSPYTYFPQTPQTPATEYKELHVGCADILPLPEINLSYSPVSHLSLGIATEMGIPVSHAGYEFGVGYYDHISSNLKFGIFGGHGLTHFAMSKDCSSTNGECDYFNWYKNEPFERKYISSNQTYHKLFFQPYILLSAPELTFTTGCKWNYLYYPDFSIIDSIYYEPYGMDEAMDTVKYYQKLYGKAISLQPYLTIIAGADKWQYLFTYAYQWIPYTNISEEYLEGRQHIITIGINRKFSLQKKKTRHHGNYE